MKIRRVYQDLERYLKPNKALLIFGPRRTGKTTLIEDYLKQTKHKYKFDSGDNIKVQQILSSQDFDEIISYVSGYDLYVIDEAQLVPNIGMALKIMVDQVPNIRVLATGSSSFELAGQVGEPLTSRKRTLSLYPISQIELQNYYNNTHELKEKLKEHMIYGLYPAVITTETKKDKMVELEEILNSYLLKDILTLERVKNSKLLIDLLRLIAFQVGSEVSLTELGSKLALDYKTVSRYLDLFEKAFILFNLRGYSKNLRSEITKKSKYYFYDNGILNAVISNFNEIEIRDDVGRLWENFVFIERIKTQKYLEIYCNNYFWRTWEQKEVDLIEEREGRLFGYEFKYSPRKAKISQDFLNIYPKSSLEIINKDNYLPFVGVESKQ